MEKKCRKCGETDPMKMAKHFSAKKTSIRSVCKTCNNKIWAARLRERRKEGKSTPQFIYEDCRNSDKKKDFENDMTREFIEELISPGCSYCEDTELRMTLDRIDNSKGHTQDNVVSACIRCNYVRKTMPYQAWLLVAKRMKIARVKGLFGDWTGRAR